MWRITLCGADGKLLPSTSCSCHPAGDRLVPRLESKRERCGRGEQNIVVQTRRHANSLLDSPLFFLYGIPLLVFLEIKGLAAFLEFFGCFMLLQQSPFTHTWLWIHSGIQVSPSNTDPPSSNMYLSANCWLFKTQVYRCFVRLVLGH